LEVNVPQVKLNERLIAKLKSPARGKQTIFWDRALPAFGVQCSAKTGAPVTYVCQGRIDGRLVRRKISRLDLMTLAEARAEAKKVLVGFGAAIDPRQKTHIGTTLRSVLDGYLKVTNLKPRSCIFYRDTITRHLGDWLDKPIASITRDEVERRHQQIAAGIEERDRELNAKRAKQHLRLAERNEQHWPDAAERHRKKHQAAIERKPRSGHGVANGTMRCLRALWNFAADKDPSIGTNPVRLKRAWFPSPRRDRLVRDSDLKKFYDAVVALENPVHRDYLLLLLFTGLRRREAASLRWADVDLKARVIRVPAAKTKSGTKLDLPMSDFVYKMLARRRAIGDTTFVFPANSSSGHVEEPKFPLHQVANECGVVVSTHDLRRTYVTVAESADISVMALKGLVNHSLGNDVTEGYVKMSVERLREPAQRVADKLKVLCGITKSRRRER
jgi:integrase